MNSPPYGTEGGEEGCERLSCGHGAEVGHISHAAGTTCVRS